MTVIETIYIVSGASLPSSCEDFKSRFPPGRDGDHWLRLPSGGEVIIYCHNMATTPESYISLYEDNYSQRWHSDGAGVYTYHKVGFNTDVGQHPYSKVNGANMGPIWGRQDPGGPHVGPMNFAVWASCSVLMNMTSIAQRKTMITPVRFRWSYYGFGVICRILLC